jgi:hypothetical protein
MGSPVRVLKRTQPTSQALEATPACFQWITLSDYRAKISMTAPINPPRIKARTGSMVSA